MSIGRVIWIVGAGVLLQGALTATATAQGTASTSVTAVVTTVGLSIGQKADLLFGAVTPGVSTVIDPRTAATPGMWEIHGSRSAEIAVSFVLPDSLRVGPHAMPIAFGAQAGCGRNRNQQNQCSYFDPAAGWVDRIRNNPTPKDTYYIWMGGTVSPAAGQFPGIYRGTITLTVAYTGN